MGMHRETEGLRTVARLRVAPQGRGALHADAETAATQRRASADDKENVVQQRSGGEQPQERRGLPSLRSPLRAAMQRGESAQARSCAGRALRSTDLTSSLDSEVAAASSAADSASNSAAKLTPAPQESMAASKTRLAHAAACEKRPPGRIRNACIKFVSAPAFQIAQTPTLYRKGRDRRQRGRGEPFAASLSGRRSRFSPGRWRSLRRSPFSDETNASAGRSLRRR